MIKALPYGFFLSLVFFLSTSFFKPKTHFFDLGFYNMENFFDTIDNPMKGDNEYLPQSKKNWDSKKYFHKVKRMANAFDSLFPVAPGLFGFCEVENESVVKDMLKASGKKESDFGILVTTENDQRGMNAGLMYFKKQFSLKSWKTLNATVPEKPRHPTRDILFAHLIFNNTTPVFVFVVHWPSRLKGENETEYRRKYAAAIMREHCDELLKTDPQARIIIMGDFNDYPTNSSLGLTLLAIANPVGVREFYNPFYDLHLAGKGSHYYNGKWGFFDMILFSGAWLQEGSAMELEKKSCRAFKSDFLLTTEKKTGEKVPYRTFAGLKYLNGYSDHLPVTSRIIYLNP
jgi:hypothetical protein